MLAAWKGTRKTVRCTGQRVLLPSSPSLPPRKVDLTLVQTLLSGRVRRAPARTPHRHWGAGGPPCCPFRLQISWGCNGARPGLCIQPKSSEGCRHPYWHSWAPLDQVSLPSAVPGRIRQYLNIHFHVFQMFRALGCGNLLMGFTC